MKIRPSSFRDACAFVAKHHRHHKPPQGHKFSLCLKVGEDVVGVVIVGRPVARMADDGLTLEVTRLCSDGTANACSKLYAAARRVAGAMGYEKVITYTLEEEDGASLFGAGWQPAGASGGGSWSREKRERIDKHPITPKKKWQATT